MDTRLTAPAKVLWHNARDRSLRYGVEFTISVKDIQMPEVCPCCGKPFVLGAPTKYPVPQAPSLDRLDSSGGYTLQNIVVICTRCNKLKGDGTLTEHQQIAEWMERHARESSLPIPT